jgi:hypothetical protein
MWDCPHLEYQRVRIGERAVTNRSTAMTGRPTSAELYR